MKLRTILVGALGVLLLAPTACSSKDEESVDGAEDELALYPDPDCRGPIEMSSRTYRSLPSDYESRTAMEKQDALWSVIGDNGYVPTCRPSSGVFLNALAALGTLPNLTATTTHASDEIPSGRRKMLHPFGTVATFDFIKDPDAPPYTGVLAPGATIRGVIRASLGGDPNILGFTPGIAVKFLIDGRPSVNVVAMRSLMGQGGDKNFLRYELSNEVNEPHADVGRDGSFLDWAKADAFAFAMNNVIVAGLARGPSEREPNALHIDHLAVHDGAGNLVPVENRKAPQRIFFRPNADLARWWDEPYNAGRDYRDMLSALSEGTDLYEVWAKETATSSPVRIGRLKTSRRFYMSPWGDYRLFFRHNDHQNNEDLER